MIGAANHIRAAFENGKEQFEWVHMRKDGSVFPAEVFLSTFEINGKKYMQSSIRDITERKLAENALRESEEKFRQLITLVPFPLCLVHADSSIEYINNRFVQTFGYTRKDIPTLQEWWQSAFPDEKYRERVFELWTESLKRAVERESDIEPAEYSVTCKDGTVRIVIISGIPIKEKFLATFLDVTAWRSVEKALQESEERYRTIIENIEDVFFRVNAKNIIIMASASAAPIFGYDSVDEIIGNSIFTIWKRSEDRAEFLLAMKKQGGAVKDFEAEFVRKDGTSLWISLSSHIIFDEQGTFIGTEGIFHDITERKKAEEALLLANKKLNLLSSITRHDITNQLLALSGFLDISKDTLTDPKNTAEFIAKEERIVQTITRQIRFTKDYEDMGVKAPSWQNVASLVQDVTTGLPVQDITLTIKTGTLEIFADPLLKQVFYNLLDNSLRYGETVSHIDVFYQKEGEDLILIWEDNGVGIKEGEKEKIFDRGFGKNTGLGMFLVREILSLTDITIGENGKQGTGARFEIRVPYPSYRFTIP